MRQKEPEQERVSSQVTAAVPARLATCTPACGPSMPWIGRLSGAEETIWNDRGTVLLLLSRRNRARRNDGTIGTVFSRPILDERQDDVRVSAPSCFRRGTEPAPYHVPCLVLPAQYRAQGGSSGFVGARGFPGTRFFRTSTTTPNRALHGRRKEEIRRHPAYALSTRLGRCMERHGDSGSKG